MEFVPMIFVGTPIRTLCVRRIFPGFHSFVVAATSMKVYMKVGVQRRAEALQYCKLQTISAFIIRRTEFLDKIVCRSYV